MEQHARIKVATHTIGHHCAVRFHRERAIINEAVRLGGLPSSGLGLSVLLGTDETIEVEDILQGLRGS